MGLQLVNELTSINIVTEFIWASFTQGHVQLSCGSLPPRASQGVKREKIASMIRETEVASNPGTGTQMRPGAQKPKYQSASELVFISTKQPTAPITDD